MWSRKGLTPEQALSYLDELEGLSESNSEHESESTSDSENEAYSRVLRKSSERILQIIKNCTKTEANNKLENVDWKLSFEDLDTFIAILYARGAYTSSKLELDSLWSIKWKPPFFREAMSKNRFKEIMKFLRERLLHNKLVSDIWNRFIYNCKISYVPGENITVDEQLFPTKVRCRFTQYMSNKPDKFGIKFWIAVDTNSKYVLNAFPYLGKDETRPQNQALSENVLLRLLEPFTKKGRSVTTDNVFTSVKLAEKLAKLNITIVGTMNRFKKEVPELVKSSRNQYETVLLKTDNDNCILTVYQAKSNKNVHLLSTLHTSVTINTDEKKKKPETVLYYNDTRYGVDVADQMARKYTDYQIHSDVPFQPCRALHHASATPTLQSPPSRTTSGSPENTIWLRGA
ncbi:hypothetical protein ILUMI_22410 [Ignelater luminosus]|uniref:PiggyBac transposable element-derived protein domain-containing protein n=1 Tax=Ignelater luminosus TaxID=2038154 RepID=A0A8K0CH67_IGNLU|nr:hypothetical protein ILUMI_22410 [Ignelater luminosus]